jgi:16S rRNA (guanine966-N2)-methyltransferase
MRIVSGRHKGRPIVAPKGTVTRPTGDRARESLFNVLAHAEWAPPLEGARVVDAFAGSGALGLEALSRGAAFCLFMETDHSARGAIRTNIETMGLTGTARLYRRSATDTGPFPSSLGTPFTLAFLDPPYGKGLIQPCLDSFTAGGWLTPNAVAMIETANDESLTLPGWTELDARTYGAARISFWQKLSG